MKKTATIEKPAAISNDEIRRAATRMIFDYQQGPFHIGAIRDGLRQLGANEGDIETASRLVDAALAHYDAEIAPRVVRGPFMTVCYSACKPGARCFADFDGTIVRHSESGRAWIVDGAEFADRVSAERVARKAAALRQLARTIGGPATV